MPEPTNAAATQPPPAGDLPKAERYLNWLMDLITHDKVIVEHTDLQKFESTTLQDHYQISLDDYVVELSHNRNAEADKNTYVMLFNNIHRINMGTATKVILAYIPLTEQQFQEFKYTADDQIARKKKEYEDKRFKDAMAPLDELLEKLSSSDAKLEDIKEERHPEAKPTETRDLMTEFDPLDASTLPDRP